jgi:hypothetical protein
MFATTPTVKRQQEQKNLEAGSIILNTLQKKSFKSAITLKQVI